MRTKINFNFCRRLGLLQTSKNVAGDTKKRPLTRPDILCTALSRKATEYYRNRFLLCLSLLRLLHTNVPICVFRSLLCFRIGTIRQGRRYTTPFWPLKQPTTHFGTGEHHWRDLCFSLLSRGSKPTFQQLSTRLLMEWLTKDNEPGCLVATQGQLFSGGHIDSP